MLPESQLWGAARPQDPHVELLAISGAEMTNVLAQQAPFSGISHLRSLNKLELRSLQKLQTPGSGGLLPYSYRLSSHLVSFILSCPDLPPVLAGIFSTEQLHSYKSRSLSAKPPYS